MSDTKQRLLDGAMETLRKQGIAGVSARNIAGQAGVNQALVFYHFGSVDDLLVAACTAATGERVAAYRERFATVGSLRELLEVGRALHEEERDLGNVAVLAQMLAGAQHDEKLARVTAETLGMWTAEIESVLRRVLAGSPFAEMADVPGLAAAISASFVGLELYEGVDRPGAERAMAALEQLGALLEVVEELGPVARRALRSKINKAAARRA
ncbi:TetR/AcrR family transcriptional regulator [Catellatospora citrea]|uniref:TetR family transcriptional regulator n=1 Tax=Catellatospora citrea TaxID=53366 RepID=A0A8J3NX39_9ACTN|nr:TetR family transcriptional regulator [Catellatospora citrea]RKE07271.1 TetR family transcriptional regulator [Catellatospora citrea]GIF95426.1 TetR family transcriptional regulator [Catellatospora citrea]